MTNAAAMTVPDYQTQRPRPVWDLVLTIVLLVVYLGVTAVASFFALFFGFAGDSCGASSECNTALMSVGIFVALIGVWVPVLPVVIVAIVLIVKRRIAFWLPLVGIVLTVGIWGLGFAMTTGSVVPS